MTIRIYLLLLILLSNFCLSKYSVLTNQIFVTEGKLFGVKSKDGELLIDSIYSGIRLVNQFEKLILPPRENRKATKKFECYLVSDSNNEKAIFSNKGELIFDFENCENIIYDEYTKTVVASKILGQNKRPQNYLYSTNSELLFDSSFKDIGYINNLDLIVLIKEDAPNREYYLYNPFSKIKIGPYNRMNIYNEDFSEFGHGESTTNLLRKLNVIRVRNERNDKNLWGIIDSNGNEILPLEYSELKYLTETEKNNTAFKQAIKPEGIELVFQGNSISNLEEIIYFDTNLEKYHLIKSKENNKYILEIYDN